VLVLVDLVVELVGQVVLHRVDVGERQELVRVDGPVCELFSTPHGLARGFTVTLRPAGA
jgi:hypothetical protein